MSDVISVCLEIMAALGQGYCLQYFLGSFLEIRKRDSRFCGLFAAVLYGMGRSAMSYLLPSDNESVRIVGKSALTFFLIVLLALLFYKGLRAMRAFLIVTFMAVSEITFFLTWIVMQAGTSVFDLWLWLVERGYITSVTTFDVLVQITAIVWLALVYGLSTLLLYLALRRITKCFREKDYSMRRTELSFLLVPAMAGLLICVLLRIIMVTVEDGLPKLLYQKYPILMVLIPAILTLSLLSILYGIKTFQDMVVLNREKSSRIILEKQVSAMQEHMTEMEHVYAGINRMKHDMKNTLAVVMELAAGSRVESANLETDAANSKTDAANAETDATNVEADSANAEIDVANVQTDITNAETDTANSGTGINGADSGELQSYLAELNRTFDRLDFRFKTGNSVADTLLNMKYHEAARVIPDLQMNADGLLFPHNLLIQGFDIGIILGNALDNAVEACRKLKEKEPEAAAFIRVSSFQKGRMFFLEIENSFDGRLIRRRQSEFPATDKADKESHGIGLVNIRSAAEKYHGGVDWSADDGVFTLTVMMQNESLCESFGGADS